MTSRRHGTRLWALAPLAAALAAGCGNYSNEDLEFENALPQTGALSANIPAVSSALELATEAELARDTHDTTHAFNGLLASLVGLVDAVRSYPPTARAPGTRVWGPIPPAKGQVKNLDWQTRMIMTLDAATGRFTYEIDVHHAGAADTDWPTVISGWFQAGDTARRGMGDVQLLTAAARAEGYDTSDFGMLDHLEITYDTLDEPSAISMTAVDVADPTSPDPAPKVQYAYSANAAGQGEMTFDIIANEIPGPAVEDMRVVSRWLSTGAGRATLTVVSGDGMGSQQTECWNDSFQATYNDKPWAAAAEDVPQDPPGDPAAFCPVIPAL